MVRTKSGCWTCRLQTKKKCDEATPTCERCARLGVHCFGYGSRPSHEELRGDRRALVAAVGPASRKEDSKFRVWRVEPTPSLPWRVMAKTRAGRPHLGRGLAKGSRTPPLQDASSLPSPTVCLTALDRVNSGVIDFLHPQLLVDYTDKVFWLDSRFYQSPGPYLGNSWMKTFLLRSQKAHLAAALMGLTWRTWQDDLSRLTDIDVTRPLTTLYTLVVQSVKDDLDHAQTLTTTEELLATGATLAKCAAMLLTFEVCFILISCLL